MCGTVAVTAWIESARKRISSNKRQSVSKKLMYRFDIDVCVKLFKKKKKTSLNVYLINYNIK